MQDLAPPDNVSSIAGPRKRRRIKVRPSVVRQAIHHLGNFLTITTSMSTYAVNRAESYEGQAAARKAFFQMFGEIVATMAALDEAIDPSGTDGMKAMLVKIKTSPEYQEMMARAQSDKIAECYTFEGGVKVPSVERPKELCIATTLRHPCKDFGGWLLGKLCTIDGERFAVMAVEYQPLKPPFQAGDPVRLVVRTVTEDGKDVHDTPQGDWTHVDGRYQPPGTAQAEQPCAADAAEGPDPGAPG